MPEQVSDGVASSFGAVGGYARCGCCGGFHAVYENAEVSPTGALDADDRGDFGSNGKTSFTTSEAAAQLTRANLSWSAGLGQAATVTYAFRSTAPATPPSDTSGFVRFSDAQIAATIQGLTAWSDVANISFQRASDADGYSNSATMLFGNYTSGSTGSAAFAYLPGSTSSTSNAGDVWVNNSLSYNATPAVLGYGPQVLTHEIGHAIGLSHPAAYNAGEGVTITYSADAVYYEDSRQYTIMSYFSESNTGGNFSGPGAVRQYSAVPLLDDIAAAQRLYGANTTTRTGDTVYGFNSTADRAWFAATAATDVIFAIWDAGGTDTLDFSGYSDNQLINLRQGAFSNVGGLTGNVAIAIGAIIENAIGGAGADQIIGNASDNRLTGGAGADTIDGGLGNDTAVFSGVRSAYTITYSGNTATITGADGTDVLTGIEQFQFADGVIAAQAPTGGLTVNGDVTDNTIEGTGFSDSLSGLGGNDNINGQGGDDNLNGGTGADSLNGGAGADTLNGGSGNDTLDGGADVDTVIYQGTSGSGVTVNLAAGTATGGDGTDVLRNIEGVIGSAYADSLTGDANGNIIDGGGGADTMRGGAGADLISATGTPGQGGGAPDIVKGQSLANLSLSNAVNIDFGFDLLARADVANAVTTPHATVAATSSGYTEWYVFNATAGSTITIDIDGAAFDSTVTLFFGNTKVAENDDNNGDNGGAATDSALTFTAQTTGAYYVEVARWTANVGTSFSAGPIPSGATYTMHVSVQNHAVQPISLIGSNIDGEDGNDTLRGGAGGDTIFGGTGNDTIQGLGGNDGLLQGGQGDDTIDGGDGDDFVFGGQAADNLFGSAGADFVQGNLGNDVVFGGAGGDSLLGGQGADTVSGDEGADLILGDLGDDQLHGNTGNDTIQGGAGSDILIGGDGIDVASYTKAVSLHYFEATAGGGWRIYDGATDVDTLTGMEWGQFGATPVEDLSVLAQKSFDAYGYMLGYADLLGAFRNNPLGAYLHYMRSGQAEGRVADSFDGLAYIASNRDLISALGANGNAGSQHYALYGMSEGRGVTFSASNYLAANSDLRAAFGTDQEAATRHYIQFGYAEGRSTGAPRSGAIEAEIKGAQSESDHHFGSEDAALVQAWAGLMASDPAPMDAPESFGGDWPEASMVQAFPPQELLMA